VASPLAVLFGAKPGEAAEQSAPTSPAEVAMPSLDGGPALAVGSGSGVGTLAVRTGVQFTGTVAAGQSNRWFTFNWPAGWHVIWYAVSTTPRSGVIQIESSYAVERASTGFITYWITIRNLSDGDVDVEGRFAVLNQ